jgi:hypothetical protein
MGGSTGLRAGGRRLSRGRERGQWGGWQRAALHSAKANISETMSPCLYVRMYVCVHTDVETDQPWRDVLRGFVLRATVRAAQAAGRMRRWIDDMEMRENEVCAMACMCCAVVCVPRHCRCRAKVLEDAHATTLNTPKQTEVDEKKRKGKERRFSMCRHYFAPRLMFSCISLLIRNSVSCK